MEQEKVFFEKKFNFKDYSVIVTNHRLTYEKKRKDTDIFDSYPIPTHFDITIEDESIGGKIEINFKDRWGSSMLFIHYMPSDLKGMFDFIGNGYGVFSALDRVP